MIATHPWCQVCLALEDLTVDHIIPIARGGTHARTNLQVLCRACNSAKGAR
jgi:5-methylcytosine-specific restriction endonuclease McrA